MSISLILPAYNESEVISAAIAEADTALGELADAYEIIVVDDGSTDETAAIVEQVMTTNEHVRLIRHDPNQGYGAALRSGFAAAALELVVFTDADCQFDLTELDRFVLLSRRYDIVCGYRIDRKDTPLRCLYSRVYNQLVRVLLRTGVRDVDCALKMFHQDVVKELAITGNGFLVNSELLVQAHQQGRSVVEVGVSHRPRTEGTSTVSIHHIPRVLSAIAKYWWNVVQFPSTVTMTSITADAELETGWFTERRCGYLQFGLLVVAAVFLLTNLGYPLIDRDETRYAEIPREMLVTGNWVLPQLNFQTYYDKPPLLYWLCAISYRLFGISEFSARLIPALASLFTVASTMYFGSRIFTRKIGLLAGMVLMLSIGFTFVSRYLLIDGVLTLFVMLSLFTTYEAVGRRSSGVRMRWWLISAVCCGLAFLTKGPVALALWLPPVMAFTWLSDSSARPRLLHYGIYTAIVMMITAPWMIAVTVEAPRFLYEFFVHHNVERFAGEFHARPFWYFVPVVLIAGHPWSFLSIPYAKFLFDGSETMRRQRPPAIGFLLLWSVWCFVFFSMSKCKLPTYLLPAAPAMALMFGHYLSQVMRNSLPPAQHWFARFWSARWATATTCFAGIGFVGFVILYTQNPAISVYAWAIVWTALLVSSLVLMTDRYHAKTAWGSSMLAASLFSVMVMHQLLPAYSRSQTLLGETSPLRSIETQQGVATISHEFSEVPFYLERSDIANFQGVNDLKLADFVAEREHCLLFVDKGVPLVQLQQHLPTDSLIRTLARRGPATVYEIHTPPGSRLARQIGATPDGALR